MFVYIFQSVLNKLQTKKSIVKEKHPNHRLHGYSYTVIVFHFEQKCYIGSNYSNNNYNETNDSKVNFSFIKSLLFFSFFLLIICVV